MRVRLMLDRNSARPLEFLHRETVMFALQESKVDVGSDLRPLASCGSPPRIGLHLFTTIQVSLYSEAAAETSGENGE
uniref:Uncharacterized protein n=1 Tax=Candidatus Kentrum sp. TC TaxID=2126339 RepID=A0A450Z2C7_9GAMM|nr:MAG: hypothetical protein BECKTC1821D_GA0114238_104218 [Candidatus Kentron sp. TC]VFK47944.1 MAG: hypothetical protein BECKTC1821E_GA0114239_10988 [Candidatus Kentron sp. TC]